MFIKIRPCFSFIKLIISDCYEFELAKFISSPLNILECLPALNMFYVLEFHVRFYKDSLPRLFWPWLYCTVFLTPWSLPLTVQVSWTLEVRAAALGLLGGLRCVLGIRNPSDSRSGYRDPRQWVSSVRATCRVRRQSLIWGVGGHAFYLWKQVRPKWESGYLETQKLKICSGLLFVLGCFF